MSDQATTRPQGRPDGKPAWALSRREAEALAIAQAGLPPRRRRWPWIVLVLILLAGAVVVWQMQRGDASTPAALDTPVEAAAEAPVILQINQDEHAVLVPQTLRRSVRVIGTLTPVRRADLAAETSGQVGEVLVRPGDRVEAGEALVQIDVERATLDRNLARSTADATRAQLALAEGQRNRALTLLERGVATESTLEEAESSVAAFRANLAALDDQVTAAELALSDATVRAPFAGVVSDRSVDPGAVVSVGTALLSIVDLSEVEMLAQAPVAAGALIRPGQAVDVAVDGIAGRRFEGRVVRVAPVAEEGTRSLTIYVALDNADGTLLGGMFATGEIVVAEAVDALAVPTDAIREDGDGHHVLVVNENVLERRAIVPGEAWAGGLTQASGLAAGDDVVTVALPDVVPGQAVTLVEF